MRAASLLLPMLVACSAAILGTDDPNDTDPFGDALCDGNPWYPDVDRDGAGDEARLVRQCDRPEPDWIAVGGDCDDGSADVGPGAEERPNAIDDNCDGTADEGTVLVDDDLDGACEDPVGPCTDGTVPGDCDDADAARFPGAVELCNRVDDDCDGVVPADEADGDSDGFLACADCNDKRAEISPDAAETCNGIDDDCDRVVDDVDADGDGAIACEGTTALDVLLVVDNSCSMFAVQASLAAQSGFLLRTLERERIAWRVGALAADDGLRLLAPAIDAAAGDTLAAVAEAVRPADRTMDPERPLQSAVTFLATPAGRAFRRPGAGLAVVVVTDEDDRSVLLPEEALAGLRGSVDAFVLGVVGGGWTGCEAARGAASPSPRLLATLELTDGPFASVCTDTWFKDWGTAWLPRAGVDCDDTNAAVHPEAQERCNTVDDDCDGVADDDHDQDGSTTCNGDCDDRDRTRAPGLPELCDGLDNDCANGVPAEEDDRDADRWRVCDGDCDDAVRSVHPGAVEICGDSIDQDCDGPDGGTVDDDGDGYTVCQGDCDDQDDLTFPWAPEHPFSGRDEDCDGYVDGQDADVITAAQDVGDSSLLTVGSPRPLVTLCGKTWYEATVSANGYFVPGYRLYFEDQPTLADLRIQAPFVAAAWGDLDPSAWTGGSFLQGHGARGPIWFIQRQGGAFTVVWDDVPDKATGLPVRAIATVHNDQVEIARPYAGGAKLMGASCDPDPATFLKPAPTESTLCLAGFDVGAAGAFVNQSTEGMVATSVCTP